MPKVLVVDDDPDIVDSLKLILSAAATSRDECMRAVEKEHPDLIILDVMMDRYTEGFRVAQRLRDSSDDSEYAAYREVPILVLTAVHRTTSFRFGPNEDSLPVDELLEKPVSADRLMATVERLLSRAPVRP